MLDRPPSDADRKRELRRARDRRRYRRQLAGLRVAPVAYSDAVVTYLIKWLWLERDKAKDTACIGDAISRAIMESASSDEK
jgi:hypothetical protein